MRNRTRQARRMATALADSYRCPDCQSECTLTDAGSGVLVLVVEHDATCPQLAARQREANQ